MCHSESLIVVCGVHATACAAVQPLLPPPPPLRCSAAELHVFIVQNNGKIVQILNLAWSPFISSIISLLI